MSRSVLSSNPPLCYTLTPPCHDSGVRCDGLCSCAAAGGLQCSGGGIISVGPVARNHPCIGTSYLFDHRAFHARGSANQPPHVDLRARTEARWTDTSLVRPPWHREHLCLAMCLAALCLCGSGTHGLKTHRDARVTRLRRAKSQPPHAPRPRPRASCRAAHTPTRPTVTHPSSDLSAAPTACLLPRPRTHALSLRPQRLQCRS